MTRYPLLESIRSTEDLKRLPEAALDALAAELRSYMIETVARTGGHLASSLGAVEIILAMHWVFQSPEDKLVFDVGHQSYAHKILTGRFDRFSTLRQKDGISGFPKRSESAHDVFDTGHASTSISAALGLARAMQLKGEAGRAVALIGDGAMTGGLAYEGLNDAGQANVPLIVILNDNEMSISPNVGAMHHQLMNLRTSPGYVRLKRAVVRLLDTGRPGHWLSRHMNTLKERIKQFLMPHLMFEEFGFTYLGPIEGHDVHQLIRVLTKAKSLCTPVIIHAVTKKGKGYPFAERNPERFHGVSRFDVATGLVPVPLHRNNSDIFGAEMLRLAEKNPDLVAVSAAMPSGTGLSGFARAYPKRFFDVGIAEEHAVTMAAGMAAGGLTPVVALYSSFLQRSYDEILHDVCLQGLPVILAVDRAGLVGADGETHQGVYDAAYLSTLPGLAIYSPSTQQELSHMLELAIARREPAAIRYNRGRLMQAVSDVPVAFGKWECLEPISECTVIATGCMVELALPVARSFGAGLINARFIRPMDEKMLRLIASAAKHVVTIEDGIACFGDQVALALPGIKVTRLCVPNRPVPQASVAEQRELCGLTAETLQRAILESV